MRKKMKNIKRLIRKPIHRLIARYLRYCWGAFHVYPYGENGRYVVLMNERQYHDYKHKAEDAED